MDQATPNNPSFDAGRRLNLLYPALFLWGAVLLAIFVFLILDGEISLKVTKYYLLPWCLLAGAVIAAPSVYLYAKGKFDPFHPLVFPAWSYLFPAFVVGGLVLAFGLAEPYFLAFVQDEQYNLPLTLVYVMLGYAGLTLGFAIPFARSIGEKISRWLPAARWQTEQVAVPGLILLFLGLANTVIAFTQGLLGFQKVEERGVFDGILFLLSLFWLEASFFLWLFIFRAKKFSAAHYLIVALLLVTSLTKSAFQGNRGSLIQIFILIAFAFVFSGRRITLKHNLAGGVLVTVALVIGMIYGTTFRTIKTTEEQMSMDQYAAVVGTTLERLTDQDISADLERGLTALAERIEAVSSLAVIVSNYEKLAPYEESYGINDNIWNETITFFIPRLIWNDKPVAIEPSKYADLYFNYSENSFTMTPMGDLLRNFGPIGVPVGMILLGFIIRLMYAALKENQEFSYWRATLFYMLLTSISYEGTYGLIVPILFKVGVFSVLGLVIVGFFVGKTKRV
jgi:hypothetical protein